MKQSNLKNIIEFYRNNFNLTFFIITLSVLLLIPYCLGICKKISNGLPFKSIINPFITVDIYLLQEIKKSLEEEKSKRREEKNLKKWILTRSNSPLSTLIMGYNLNDFRNEVLILGRLNRFEKVMNLGDFENDYEFAKVIKVSEDSIAQIRQSGIVPPEITKNLSLYLGISDVWFDTGTGEVFFEGSITTDSKYLQMILNDPITKLTYTNFHEIENGSEISSYLLIDSITKIAEKQPSLTAKELLEKIRVMMYKTELIYQKSQFPPSAV